MIRDHPVYPWAFEWAADLMTRYGRFGKDSSSIDSWFKVKQRHCAIRRKDLLQTAETIWVTIEETWRTWDFSGLRRRVEEEQWDNEFARSIKAEPRQPVPGINSDHVPAVISDRAGMHLEEDQADARLGQQDDGIDPPEAREVSMPPDRLSTQVRSDTLKRMYVTRGLGKKYGPTPGCPGCATIGSHHQASRLDTCRSRTRAELEKSEEGKEYLAREQSRVDARKQEETGDQATSVLSQRNGIAHQRNSGEWMSPPQLVLHPPVQAEDQPWSSTVDRPGNELPIFKQKTWRITSIWTQMKVHRHFPQAEGESSDGRMFDWQLGTRRV